MTLPRLAIPAVSFILLSVFIPSRAQNTPDPPSAQLASSSVGTQPPPALSDEDMARLLLVRKQYTEAEAIFRRLTAEQPKNAVYWNELGISRHSQSQLGAALKCYEKSAKLDSQYADPLNNAGTIWYERKQFPKAIRAYRKAIKLRDDFAPFYLNLGYAQFNEKNYNDSIASFRKALQLDPGAFDTGRSRMGTVIQDRSMSTDRGHFYFLLAKSFAEAGNIDRCVVYLKKARDEGFKEMNTVKSDPSFAAVLKDPAVQEALETKPMAETSQP
jgi:tetratricopeptide (TPR) repeat protein